MPPQEAHKRGSNILSSPHRLFTPDRQYISTPHALYRQRRSFRLTLRGCSSFRPRSNVLFEPRGTQGVEDPFYRREGGMDRGRQCSSLSFLSVVLEIQTPLSVPGNTTSRSQSGRNTTGKCDPHSIHQPGIVVL